MRNQTTVQVQVVWVPELEMVCDPGDGRSRDILGVRQGKGETKTLAS